MVNYLCTFMCVILVTYVSAYLIYTTFQAHKKIICKTRELKVKCGAIRIIRAPFDKPLQMIGQKNEERHRQKDWCCSGKIQNTELNSI